MGLANFTAAKRAFTPAHRSMVREREPLGREKLGRERPTLEFTFRPQAGASSDFTPMMKKPPKLSNIKSENDRLFDNTASPEPSVKSPERESTSGVIAIRQMLSEKVKARRANGDAIASEIGASMEYQFPRLPADTAARQARFNRGEHVEPAVAFIHGYESRPLFHGWRPFHDPFSRDVNAPDPVLEEEPPLLNPELGSGPFYGRYVGPSSPKNNPGPPLTPVDKAAYIHDAEYYEIYERYQYSEFEYGLSFAHSIGLGDNAGAVQYFGWAGNATSLDPGMQLELAWADTKLITGSWYNIGEGLSNSFYSGGAGQRALITDLAWAGAITVLYGNIILFRLGMAAVGAAFQLLRGFAGVFNSLGERIGGDVGRVVSWIGDAANWVLDIAARVISVGAMAQFTYNVIVAGAGAAIVGGIIYVGGKIVEGIGKAVEWVGDRLGCFITEAVVRTSGESDDCPTLSILRRFRDEYVASRPGGRKILLAYLECAPTIVAAVERGANSRNVWREVRETWIDPAVEAIRRDQKEQAFVLYIRMIESLAIRFGITLRYDGSRHHWKRDPRLAIV